MARPPYPWLTPSQILDLPEGIALSVETYGRHGPRTLGRYVSFGANLHLRGPAGPIVIDAVKVKRARVVPGLYEPGDPVLRPGISADDWRGGVVRLEGRDVLVETLDGGFTWLGEHELEPAEARESAGAPL